MENRVSGRSIGRKTSTLREEGQELAVAALSFLAQEPDRLSRFLDICGLGPHNLRAAAADPGFLTAVLDYLLGDEPLLIAFAASRNLAPESIAATRRAMGGPPPAEF
ncbi:MAG: DUF3572 domain-containing protein [Pseudomonadota bacterium]|nr:DUF3572 domain-containing protein [Pseudomonadota bacterium]